jgi:hypothetical protein
LTVIKSGRKPQMAALLQNRLADGPSVVTQDLTRRIQFIRGTDVVQGSQNSQKVFHNR